MQKHYAQQEVQKSKHLNVHIYILVFTVLGGKQGPLVARLKYNQYSNGCQFCIITFYYSGLPLTVIDEIPVTAVDYLPPSPTLPQDLPECVTRSAREHSTERKESQKLGTSSMSNPATVVSAVTIQTTKKTPFISQEDSCASKPSDNELTSEGASISLGPSSTNQGEETQRPLETGSPTPTSVTSSFPYLKVGGLTAEQQEGLSIRLCVESEDIVHKFWRLHSRVYESLREQNIPVGRLVAHLLSLHAFDPVYKDSQKPALQSFIKELRSAGSIEDVLFIIRDYMSFFNYHVIEHIVDGLGTDQDRVELQNYERDFDEYSKRRVYECPPDYGSKSDTEHVDLVVKVDSVFEEFTVKELKKFQYRLGRIFCVTPQSVLRLCRVEEGCLQLIFQVPSFVQQEIFPLSTEQESALAAEGVIRLTCGDYQFAAKVCCYCFVTCHWCMSEVFSTHIIIEDCKSWQLPGGCNSGVRLLAVVARGLVFNFQ